LLQGEEDKVVPPNQAVDCYEALKAKGLSTALVLFPGEQHGFRQVHPWSNEERIAVPNSHRSLRRPLHLPWRIALHARRCMRSKLRNGPLSLDLTISWAPGASRAAYFGSARSRQSPMLSVCDDAFPASRLGRCQHLQ